MTLYQYFSHLSSITVQLQKWALDIIEAHEEVAEVKKVFEWERQDVDTGFQIIYDQSVRMADKVGSNMTKPRKANAP